MTENVRKVLLYAGGEFGREVRAVLEQRQVLKVLTAASVSEAIAEVRREACVLAILGGSDDVGDGSAAAVCAEFRSKAGGRIPVVLISNDESDESKAAARSAGANAIVPEASGTTHLMYVISEILSLPPRRRVKFAAVVGIKTLRGSKESLARAVNVSDGGMGLETTQPYQIQTPITVKFVPPGERQFLSAAVVRWIRRVDSERYQVGVEFTDMPQEERARLVRFLERSPV